MYVIVESKGGSLTNIRLYSGFNLFVIVFYEREQYLFVFIDI